VKPRDQASLGPTISLGLAPGNPLAPYVPAAAAPRACSSTARSSREVLFLGRFSRAPRATKARAGCSRSGAGKPKGPAKAGAREKKTRAPRKRARAERLRRAAALQPGRGLAAFDRGRRLDLVGVAGAVLLLHAALDACASPAAWRAGDAVVGRRLGRRVCGPRQQVALDVVDPGVDDGQQLVGRLDALGDDARAEVAAQANDARDEARPLGSSWRLMIKPRSSLTISARDPRCSAGWSSPPRGRRRPARRPCCAPRAACRRRARGG
jgi:hypothetical protein